jgi:hypothetical protein
MVAAVAFGALLLFAALAPSDGSAFGGGCTATGEATLDFDDAGTAVRMSAAFKAGPGASDDEIGGALKGTDASGDPVGSSSYCGGEDTWHLLTINLGDRDDSARLDATHPPQPLPDLGPVPASIDVTTNGGPGRDTIRGHSGLDYVSAGGGADNVIVADGDADQVNCGKGDDRAVVDRHKDTVTGCEHLEFG